MHELPHDVPPDECAIACRRGIGPGVLVNVLTGDAARCSQCPRASPTRRTGRALLCVWQVPQAGERLRLDRGVLGDGTAL